MIYTKLVATLGPATSDLETMRRLLGVGVNVVRLNFSHGSLDLHEQTLTMLREAAADVEHPVAVLGDLCGPKIRLGVVADHEGTGGMSIEPGDTLVIGREEVEGRAGRVSANYEYFVDDVEIGHRVLIEDGMLRFVVTDKTEDEVICNCTTGGLLQSRKGINLPESQIRAATLTEKDMACADWAAGHEFDFLALSFVRSAEDIRRLRRHLVDGGRGVPDLIAKIEKPEAVEHIDEIIAEADGLMIARGDLGVEMDLARVPLIQKDLIRRCRIAAKPAIVATQMLQSMIEQATPTRAEVSDVANAILDRADAMMLSGETAVGRNPVLTVNTMAHIASTVESHLVDQPGGTTGVVPDIPSMAHYAAMARAVRELVVDLDIRLIVLGTQRGEIARVFSKIRFDVPIMAMSIHGQTRRRLSLCYGVKALPFDPPTTYADFQVQLDAMLKERGLAESGDRVVIIGCATGAEPGRVKDILVHMIDQT
ncbi:MAG: pyruvate kinase [Planctomycetaceae bacterium]|nr:pyruvate kinase [Planctomycetaceae bacterium]